MIRPYKCPRYSKPTVTGNRPLNSGIRRILCLTYQATLQALKRPYWVVLLLLLFFFSSILFQLRIFFTHLSFCFWRGILWTPEMWWNSAPKESNRLKRLFTYFNILFDVCCCCCCCCFCCCCCCCRCCCCCCSCGYLS